MHLFHLIFSGEGGGGDIHPRGPEAKKYPNHHPDHQERRFGNGYPFGYTEGMMAQKKLEKKLDKNIGSPYYLNRP